MDVYVLDNFHLLDYGHLFVDGNRFVDFDGFINGDLFDDVLHFDDGLHSETTASFSMESETRSASWLLDISHEGFKPAGAI